MAQWRVPKALDIPMVDTTVKSGAKFLAPMWHMVLEHKAGILSNDGYTELFYELMEKSQVDNPEQWDALLAMDEVAIACYCPDGAFCHRRLLVGILGDLCDKRDIPFAYLGELTRASKNVKDQTKQTPSGDGGVD